MEQVPGDGWSTQCDADQVILQSVGVCNLMAQSILQQVEGEPEVEIFQLGMMVCYCLNRDDRWSFSIVTWYITD